MDPADVCEDFFEFSTQVTILRGQWICYSACRQENEKESTRVQLKQILSAYPAYAAGLPEDVQDFVRTVLPPQQHQNHEQESLLLPCEPETVRVGSLRLAAAVPPLSSSVSTPSSQSCHTLATVQREEALDTIDLDHDERQTILSALLEEELRWKPWLIPEHEHSFRGTRLALGGPRSCQGLPPIAPPSPTVKRKRRARHRRAALQTERSGFM
ncbi:uncharacterized protein LOC113036757 [Astatotilapia calliptera]|uniref:uncharacterized protein LOC113013413 n=1 Tax=Astatotilapia calliptera TaxID=8154 RepID=UPI000E426AD4|nr:uncharacterized protein LOC113013413 [Astatotilapia calliptera]XP_026014278.1 uncharacterized protein LOC113016034 [Astatotilapia calliptera]XP_026038023.1 uncharacterized protein LOC113030628 [Astatotilapia calliptera]XP_026038024.1 uncharacterized protein LOC113030629 [Astatotilapia calliptera]XP_026049005.1 uncharacterized protein LOC113036757 [Astatotilapia calliptera]